MGKWGNLLMPRAPYCQRGHKRTRPSGRLTSGPWGRAISDPWAKAPLRPTGSKQPPKNCRGWRARLAIPLIVARSTVPPSLHSCPSPSYVFLRIRIRFFIDGCLAFLQALPEFPGTPSRVLKMSSSLMVAKFHSGRYKALNGFIRPLKAL